MKKYTIITLVVGIVVVFTYILFNSSFKGSLTYKPKFPPSNVFCFNLFMDEVNGRWYSEFQIPSFNLSEVTHFKCNHITAFEQYEVVGTDKEGNSFYLYKASGGMSAGGGDSYYEICYKRNNSIVKNEKITGRESVRGMGSCLWTTLPSQNSNDSNISTYEYTK